MKKSNIYSRIQWFAISFLASYSLIFCNLTASAQEFSIYRAYFNIGLVRILPADARFSDAEKPDSNLPLLYGGNPDLFTDGKLTGTHLSVGLGYRFFNSLRGQVEFSTAGNLNFKGNANYSKSGDRQPSMAKINIRQLLLVGFYDFPERKVVSDIQLQPYLGLGAGYTNYRLKDFVQRFPDPDNPEGYLRRGPNGEIPYTRLPQGSGQEFTYMFSTGMVIPVTDRMKLDLSYRYTDAGEIRTDIDDITIVRYGEDGSRREIPVKIDETVADFKTQALLVTLRYDF